MGIGYFTQAYAMTMPCQSHSHGADRPALPCRSQQTCSARGRCPRMALAGWFHPSQSAQFTIHTSGQRPEGQGRSVRSRSHLTTHSVLFDWLKKKVIVDIDLLWKKKLFYNWKVVLISLNKQWRRNGRSKHSRLPWKGLDMHIRCWALSRQFHSWCIRSESKDA